MPRGSMLDITSGRYLKDQQRAQAEATKVLTEVTKSEPNRGRIRRALIALKGFFAPVAIGLSKGAGQGAQELAKKAIEHIDTLALPG
jgi:hypothetical protein